MRTTGGRVDQVRSGISDVRIGLDGYGRRRRGCCTLVLHADTLTLKCQLEIHGSGGGRPPSSEPAQMARQQTVWSASGPRTHLSCTISFGISAWWLPPTQVAVGRSCGLVCGRPRGTAVAWLVGHAAATLESAGDSYPTQPEVCNEEQHACQFASGPQGTVALSAWEALGPRSVAIKGLDATGQRVDADSAVGGQNPVRPMSASSAGCFDLVSATVRRHVVTRESSMQRASTRT
jgi:hypothetical protein